MMSEREILEACACHRVRTAARAVTRAYDEALRSSGLRAPQLAILVATAAYDALSITALAEVMGMDRTTLVRNLRPLESEGLIAIGPEGRWRSRALEITKKGRSRLLEALPLWETAQRTLHGRLGDPGWDRVRSSLDDLIRVTQLSR